MATYQAQSTTLRLLSTPRTGRLEVIGAPGYFGDCTVVHTLMTYPTREDIKLMLDLPVEQLRAMTPAISTSQQSA